VKNVDHQHHWDEEAARGTNGNPNGPPCICHNLDEEFNIVGDQSVEQTPSANLAVVFNKLARLPQTLEVKKNQCARQSGQVEVNEIWRLAPSSRRLAVVTPVAPTMTGGASGRVSSALTIKREAPISIEGT
jgi:hypothetical protein